MPLQQIAASTKISVSLLRSLEAGDLSRWPKGLFRRSYVRDYLRAVGLPVEPTIAEFLHLFPDADDRPIMPIMGHDQCGEDETPRLSLTLGTDRTELAAKAGRHLVAAAVDTAVVVGLSVAAAWWIPADFSTRLAAIALVYYSVATASVGRSFGAQWVLYRSSARWRRAAVPDAPRDSLFEKIRRLRDLSVPHRRAAARDIVRVPWNAILLRLRFLR
jgi:hypothetical protein